MDKVISYIWKFYKRIKIPKLVQTWDIILSLIHIVSTSASMPKLFWPTFILWLILILCQKNRQRKPEWYSHWSFDMQLNSMLHMLVPKGKRRISHFTMTPKAFLTDFSATIVLIKLTNRYNTNKQTHMETWMQKIFNVPSSVGL